jgi:hypothetical protein
MVSRSGWRLISGKFLDKHGVLGIYIETQKMKKQPKKLTLVINRTAAVRILNSVQPGKSITGSGSDLDRILGLQKGNGK